VPIIGDTSAASSQVVRAVTLGSLNFDAIGEDGSEFLVTDIEGWDGSAGSTVALTQKLRAPGGWLSVNPQLTPSSLTVTGHVSAPDLATLKSAVHRLKSAASLEQTTLTVSDRGGQTLTMRVCRQGPPLVQSGGLYWDEFSLSLVAADPRKFGTSTTVRTGLPSQSGGLTFPVTFPVTWSAVSVTGQVSLVNDGNIVGPVQAVAYGPLTDFTVTHIGSSGTRAVSVALPLLAGEYVVIDMEAETVLAQGQASRTQYVTSRAFSGFDPGQNAWAFTSSTYSSSAQFAVTATPAWE